MATTASASSRSTIESVWYTYKLGKFGTSALITLFACMLVAAFLTPFLYSSLTSIKDKEQITASARGTILPVDPVLYTYEGVDYEVFTVPTGDGNKEWALVNKGRESADFVDPENPDAGLITWEGRWRTLKPVTELAPRWDNFSEAWRLIKFPRLLRNTAAIAGFGVIGTLMSCICVAYAFARFPIPGKRIIFMILISTIILPTQVTLVPTYAFFSRIHWVGTWLPLIVPHFFANAYNVFLIRQYFMTLPKELDEAAMIDGAGPFRILVSVIIPQSWPVIVAVALFHTVFAWNDYFTPLIYLLGKPDLVPISVGIQAFNFQYGAQPHLIQSTALMGLVLPVLVFFFAQRVFMRGVVITGVEK
jgi:multiple sugar transport system permease protein